VSLIADSLKKAVKEKTTPQWDPSQEVNLVGKRDPLKHPGLWSVFRIGLLIILPTAILAYLIATGAFDLKKPWVTPKPDLPVSIPPEEAKVPSDLKISPGVPEEKILKAPPAEPSPEPQAEEAPVLERKAVTPEVPPSPEKREPVVKKVLPSYPPKKKLFKKLERAIELQKEKVVTLPSPVLKPEISEEEAVKVVPPELPAKPLVEEAPVLEKKVEVPEAPPVPKPVEEKIPEPEIAKIPEIPSKPAEEEIVKVAPSEPPAKPLVEEAPVLEKKAEVPEAPPAPKPVEEKIPEPEIAKIPETPAKPSVEPLLKTVPSPLSPTIPARDPGEKEEKPESLAVKVQKEEVASLPSPGLKPEIIRTDPARQENVFQNSDFYFNRAVFFQQAKDWQKALDNYVKAEKLDPNNPDTYNNKGVIYKELGQYDQALDEFLRAIFLDPKYAKAYNNIGVVYFMQKNYAEGVRNYLKAIDLNPSNLEAFNNLAIIYKKQKDLEKARAVLNRALAMDPDHPGTNYNLAVLYEENKEITPALHYYRRFIELGRISYPSLVIQVKTHVETLKP
jgi:type IV pilus biogenesis/stability protein PilW